MQKALCQQWLARSNIALDSFVVGPVSDGYLVLGAVLRVRSDVLNTFGDFFGGSVQTAVLRSGLMQFRPVAQMPATYSMFSRFKIGWVGVELLRFLAGRVTVASCSPSPAEIQPGIANVN